MEIVSTVFFLLQTGKKRNAPRQEVHPVRIMAQRRQLVPQDRQRFLCRLRLHRLKELLLSNRKLDGLLRRTSSVPSPRETAKREREWKKTHRQFFHPLKRQSSQQPLHVVPPSAQHSLPKLPHRRVLQRESRLFLQRLSRSAAFPSQISSVLSKRKRGRKEVNTHLYPISPNACSAILTNSRRSRLLPSHSGTNPSSPSYCIASTCRFVTSAPPLPPLPLVVMVPNPFEDEEVWPFVLMECEEGRGSGWK